MAQPLQFWEIPIKYYNTHTHTHTIEYTTRCEQEPGTESSTSVATYSTFFSIYAK